MKILIINVNYKNSSTGKIVYDLSQPLIRDGHTVKVCYGRGPDSDEPNVNKFSSNVEVYAHALLTRVTGLTGSYSYFATKKLISLIEEFKPDVVHIHELHAYFVNIAPVMNYLKSKNIKTVWTFHCEFMYTGKCGYAYDCDNWKTECNKCPQVNEYPASYYFDFTKKMFNDKKRLFEGFDNLTIVTPSQWLADRVKQSFLSNKDVVVIHNGIDIENVFHPKSYEHLRRKHNIKEDEKVVLAVAPDIMSERKGGRWVVEIAKRMRDNHNVKFILIGVKNHKEDFGPNVIVLGRTSNQQELAEYYSMADVTILTSKKETFSLVCAESLACGTPIVGFDSGAPKEVAPEGYGIFVPYGDIDRLTDQINSVLFGDGGLNNSDECVVFAKENYSSVSMTDKYRNLFNAVI